MATNCSNTFKKLKFPLHNTRWSWGAVNEEHKAVMFRFWAHQIVKLETLKFITPTDLQPDSRCALVYAHSDHVESNNVDAAGTTERRQHIELIRRGYKAFGICVHSNKNVEDDWEYTIKSHISQRVWVFDQLLEVGTDYPDTPNCHLSIANVIPAQDLSKVMAEAG